MFTHVILISLKDKREETKNRLKNVFLGLKEQVREIKELEIGIDAVHSENAYDLALIAKFDSREDFDAYENNLAHRKLVQDEIIPILDNIIAVNF